MSHLTQDDMLIFQPLNKSHHRWTVAAAVQKKGLVLYEIDKTMEPLVLQLLEDVICTFIESAAIVTMAGREENAGGAVFNRTSC